VTADDVVGRRGVVRPDLLRTAGVRDEPSAAHRAGEWWVAPSFWSTWRAQVGDIVRRRSDVASGGVSLEEVRHELGLPDVDVAAALCATAADVVVHGGRARIAQDDATIPDALAWLVDRLSADPLGAPEAGLLDAHGVDRRLLGHGVRTGLLLHLGGGVYVAPDAPDRAVRQLASLDQPFSVSAARVALESTRRVVVPLLEHLDATRRTRKEPDGTRFLVAEQR
jgi:selenocysteine-specific elongation factor